MSANEPTVEELVSKALEAGVIDLEFAEDMRESADLEEALSMFYGYVTDNDPEALLREWGIIDSAAPPQLPERFVDRLKGIIPESSDPYLYQQLEGDDPYSIAVKAQLDGQVRFLADELDDDQKARLDALYAEWTASYTPPPVIATVELFSLQPTENDPQ